MNYYSLDKIEKTEEGLTIGYRKGHWFEVFYLSEDVNDEDYLEANGFAKCDAPDWPETMLVEESSITPL